MQENSEKGNCIFIGSIRTLGTILVPSLMRQFKETISSNIRFGVHSENGFSTSILKAVEDGKTDFCFTSTPGDPALFESVAFPSSRFVVITPLSHPLCERTEVRLEETIPYPQICFSREAGLRKVIDTLFLSINAYPEIEMESEEDGVVSGLVAAGFGIAVVPYSLLLKSLPVKVLKITNPEGARTACLSRLRGRKLPPSSEHFWRLSIEKLRKIQSERSSSFMHHPLFSTIEKG